MSLPTVDQPFIGDWYCERVIGTGAFGTVTLWKNHATQNTIAIKKCILNENNPMFDKQKERWEYEVNTMTNNIKNENIVCTVNVKPDSFVEELMKTNKIKLPFLIMEYCEAGNLRNVLSERSNCSGLVEAEVRNVLKSLRNAISYLHCLDITHRDIKPENIVLTKKNGQTIYKITDLGYAKSLDKNSIDASVVGTLEYIAPELIKTGRYNCSVDYWSMGVLGFEVICGCRPFLPHASIAQLLLYVQQKKSEHIRITQNNNEDVIYEKTVFPENRVSKTLKNYLENWLKLALELNPKQRGHIFELPKKPINDAKPSTSSPNGAKPKTVTFAENINLVSSDGNQGPTRVLKIFTMLDEILSKKILIIFSLYNYSFLSYEIDETMTMAQLIKLIENDTQIPSKDVQLILPVKHKITKIDNSTKPIDLYYLDKTFDNPMVYVLKRGSILQKSIIPVMPTVIEEFFQNTNAKQSPHTLRQFSSNSYYFIKKEHKLYKTMLSGVKEYALYLNDEIMTYRNEINKMRKLVYNVQGNIEQYLITFNHTQEKLQEKMLMDMMQHAFNLWSEKCAKTVASVRKLSSACESIIVRYESVLRRSRESVDHDLLKTALNEHFDMRTLQANVDEIRLQIYNKTTNESSKIKLVKYLYNSLKSRDSMLYDEKFIKLQQMLVEISIENDKIKDVVDNAIKEVERYRKEIVIMNLDHHNNIWALMNNMAHLNPINNITDDYMPDIDNILFNLKLESTNSLTGSIMQKSNNASVLEDCPNKVFCFGEGADVKSLINDNDTLLLATQDLIRDGFEFLPISINGDSLKK